MKTNTGHLSCQQEMQLQTWETIRTIRETRISNHRWPTDVCSQTIFSPNPTNRAQKSCDGDLFPRHAKSQFGSPTSTDAQLLRPKHSQVLAWPHAGYVTYANVSIASVSSFSIGNFTRVFSGRCSPVTAEDLQSTGGVRGSDIVQVRSPDGLSVFPPRHRDSLAAREGALQRQGFTQLVADIL